jgi:hypothetical protein
MKISEKFRSRHMKASDILGDTRVVIAKVMEEEVGRDREDKIVLYFKNMSQGLPLNATNGKRLARAFGDDTDAWSGKTIVLYLEPTSYNGEECMGVRVRVPDAGEAVVKLAQAGGSKGAAAVRAQAPLNTLDDEIPF